MSARRDQVIILISALLLSWLGMMAVHELGHVVGAVLTGGNVLRVVLHPAAISRTEVLPNPAPLIVAWAGPLFGCLVPGGILQIARGMLSCRRSLVINPEPHLNNRLSAIESEMCDVVIAQQSHNLRATGRSAIVSFLRFFFGFCCIANGAYLGIGVFDRIGDAGEILKAGSPRALLIAFGLIAFSSGMLTWHRLGSPFAIFYNRIEFNPWFVKGVVATLFLVIVVECLCSPT